jgi:four helix bundle protein
MVREGFHEQLKELINEYILLGYELSKKFPPEERYGMRSQGTRALLSVMLNYIEGYARGRDKSLLYQYEVSYGYLKESIYVFYLAFRVGYISKGEYLSMFKTKDRIGGMLWKTLEGIRKDISVDN